MIGWSGRRKALTVLLFVGPTLLGILLLNVFPILLSTYVSFTNRNKFHPKTSECFGDAEWEGVHLVPVGSQQKHHW